MLDPFSVFATVLPRIRTRSNAAQLIYLSLPMWWLLVAATYEHGGGDRLSQMTLLATIKDKIIVEGDCWLWTGALHANGYAIIGRDGKQNRVTKILFEDYYDCEIGKTKLKRTCGNRACVNPEHAKPFSLDFSQMRSFWASVRRDEATGCWVWQGARIKSGYGIVGAHVYVHRFVYDYIYGLAPDLHVCHRCDNPPCCNPFHIFAGTHADNMRDMSVKLRAAKASLTVEQVHIIRASSSKALDVANQLHVPKHVVDDVRAGKNYKYV